MRINHLSTSVKTQLQWHPNIEYILIKAFKKELCTIQQHIYQYNVQITLQLSGFHLHGCKSKKNKTKKKTGPDVYDVE